MHLTCRDIVCRREPWNAGKWSAVREVSASFSAGCLAGISGEDGCGKGLLLNILGLLEKPDSGDVLVCGQETAGLDVRERTALRNRLFGFLFSQPGLLPAFTVAENVAMPLFRICGANPMEAQDRTLEVLELCDIAGEGDTLAGRLDARTSWRAAFARALVHNPKVLIAISPRMEDDLLPIARFAAEETGLCILWAGAGEPLNRHAHRRIQMESGRVTTDTLPAPVA